MNIFIDAGLYSGGVLRKYLTRGVIDDTWTIYAFEPNPELDTKLMLSSIPLKVKLFKKAVWVKNEKLTFHISGRHDAAGIADLTGHTDPTEVTVQAMDFPKFVADLPEAYIICSMDIEGAEFKVLEKMLEDGSIDRISILDIEFHHRFMNDFTHKDANRLIRKIRDRGTSVRLKVPTQ